MTNKNSVALQDLMGVLFRTKPEDLLLDNTYGLWYVLSNNEMGIRTRNSTSHVWLRIMGVKVVEKDGIILDRGTLSIGGSTRVFRQRHYSP